METNIQKRNIESTFEAESQNFTIEASAKAFQILSSNLYTDKPLAIVRELSANALDAHKQAKEKRPFSITLPSRMNPSFELRDYGIGMSPGTIKTLYTTFFGSDKNHSNDSIGGLGLGSKTPFSYTDTFTLLSFWKGIKYTWLCMIQEDGQPSISMVQQDKSDEDRGIQYIIPVKQEDFLTFSNKARAVLKYFPKGSYEANDIEVTPVLYSLKRDEYGMRKESGSWPRVIMGPIAYRLDRSALDSTTQQKFSALLTNGRLDIFCNIGDIDIQASREALSYDKLSQKQIITVLQRVHDRIQADVEKDIASCPTYIDACIKGKELAGQASINFDGMRWRGTELQKRFEFGKTDGATVVSGRNLTASDALSLSFSTYSTATPEVAKDAIVLYYDPTVQYNKIRLKTAIMKDRGQTYIVFSDEQDMFAYQSAIQNFDNISTEDLPVPEKEDVTYASINRAPVQLKYRAGNGGWEALSSSIDEINAMEDTCWVPLSGGGSEPWEDDEDERLHKLINSFAMVRVVGVPKSLKRKSKHITLPTLAQHARAKMIEYIDSEARYDEAFTLRHQVPWMGTFESNVDKKRWGDLPLVQTASLWVNTQALARARETIKDLFGWELKPRTEKQIDAASAKLAKGYELMQVLDSMYGYSSMRKSDFVEQLLTLIHRRK